jgi:C4-dicarboxylate transporter, DctQ subunit
MASGPSQPPRAVAHFLRALDGLAHITGIAAAIGVALIVAAMLAEIVARNVLGISLLFTWEYASYLLAAVIFLAAANAVRVDYHVRVGIVGELLRPGVARAIELAWLLVALALAVFLFRALLFITMESLGRGIVSHTPMRTPLVYPYAVITLGAFAFVLQIVARLVRVALGLPVRPEDPAGPVGA